MRATDARRYGRPISQSRVATHLRRTTPQPVYRLQAHGPANRLASYGLRPQRMTVGQQFWRGHAEHRYLYQVLGSRRIRLVNQAWRLPPVGHRLHVHTWNVWHQPWRRYVVVASTGAVLWSFGCPLGACDRIVAACRSGNYDTAVSLLETAAVEDRGLAVAAPLACSGPSCAVPTCSGPSPCTTTVPCQGPSPCQAPMPTGQEANPVLPPGQALTQLQLPDQELMQPQPTGQPVTQLQPPGQPVTQLQPPGQPVTQLQPQPEETVEVLVEAR